RRPHPPAHFRQPWSADPLTYRTWRPPGRNAAAPRFSMTTEANGDNWFARRAVRSLPLPGRLVRLELVEVGLLGGLRARCRCERGNEATGLGLGDVFCLIPFVTFTFEEDVHFAAAAGKRGSGRQHRFPTILCQRLDLLFQLGRRRTGPNPVTPISHSGAPFI